MEPLELDTAIEELETRVERLRSLYEQYFMGIEKIPPAVVHKDVERRIYALRREQIRNTAKRFKLQTTIQRYKTFQMYWQRILREIENGTYKRHVLRAERTVAAAKTPLLPGAVSRESNLPDSAPDSESFGLPRGRKSIAPSSPRHSVPTHLRHSTLPPPEKIEAFTRALERDLAAALDGNLDFGQLSLGMADDSLDLDEHLPSSSTARQRNQPGLTSQQQKNLPVPTVPRPGALGHTRQLAADARKLPSPPRTPSVALNKPLPPVPKVPDPPQVRPAPAPSSSLSSERVRQLHHDLVEAKAKTADTKPVSLNALTRKLENTAKQLREKHAGKRVDFAVVIKDGKAIVKPIVR